MTGLDSITLDASGFLDMDRFSDTSELPDDVLVGLRQALRSDPVDEPGTDDWSTLVNDVVADGGNLSDEGPFVLDVDDGGIAGVRDASADDEPSDAGPTGEVRDDDPTPTRDGADHDPLTLDLDDDGTGFGPGPGIAVDEVIGLDLADVADLDGGVDADTVLTGDAGMETAADAFDDLGGLF